MGRTGSPTREGHEELVRHTNTSQEKRLLQGKWGASKRNLTRWGFGIQTGLAVISLHSQIWPWIKLGCCLFHLGKSWPPMPINPQENEKGIFSDRKTVMAVDPEQKGASPGRYERKEPKEWKDWFLFGKKKGRLRKHNAAFSRGKNEKGLNTNPLELDPSFLHLLPLHLIALGRGSLWQKA